MTDFPSISDLSAKGGKKSAATAALGVGNDPQTKFNKKMGEIEVKDKEKLVAEVAAAAGLPHIDLSVFPVTAEALKIVPEVTAKEKKVICFFATPEEIRLGSIEASEEAKEMAYQIGERHHAHVQIYLISEHSLARVIALYANLPIIKPVVKEINITDEDVTRVGAEIASLQDLQKKFVNITISDILTLMVASALKMNSSDIHVEAEEKGIAVRYRIDGVLQDVATLPKEQWKQFVSRIKLLAALKINVTDRPQDGRVTLTLGKGGLDIRVSTMPTFYGESVVMRILKGGDEGSAGFDDLGFRGLAFEQLKKEVARPNGMIITTGPTGSGKTTTMYAVLKTLNKPGVKIITLEDPVEIRMEGINQSQVDASHNYTFAKGLRSILRQDPDICMVGEIRDLETAEIAIQAALTGHLMLSTIHTNNAAGAIPRFLSMGVKPFLLAPALNSIIGQRLVRRVCKYCQEEAVLTPEQKKRVEETLATLPEAEKNKVDLNNLHFYHGKGCEKCSGLGYKGRVGIYEVFVMTKEVEALILSGQVSEYLMEEIAVKNGMVTMVQDGLLKALDKITTVEEVFRVTE